MLSATLNRAIARVIFDSLYAHSPQGDVLPPSARVDGDTAAGLHSHFLGQNLFPTDLWTGAAPADAPLEPENIAALFHACATPATSGSPSSSAHPPPPLLPRPLLARFARDVPPRLCADPLYP